MTRTVTWMKWESRSYPAVSGLVEKTEPAVEIAGVAFPASLVDSFGMGRRSEGERYIARIATFPEPAGYCRGRARGWWDANDLDLSARYDALAQCFSGVARTVPIKATL